MRVVLSSFNCAPNPGGIAAHVLHLSVALRRLGVGVHVLGGCQETALRVPFRPPFEEFRVRPAGRVPKVSGALHALWARREMARLVRAGGVDVIHIHSLLSDAYAVLGMAPTAARVATNHSLRVLQDEERGRNRRLYRILFGRYDAVIAPSRELEANSPYMGVPPGRVHYIPNGVDGDIFAPGEPDEGTLRRVAPLGALAPVVLVPRRLERKNGVHVLLEAIPRVLAHRPEACFVVAGDGEERPALEARARDLGLGGALRLLGTVPNPEMVGLYRLARVCVLPSLREATSISGLEAMACGRAVVGTTAGGIPEIIDDGATGLLVPPGDPEALSTAILRLLADSGLAARLGAEARRRVLAQFSWQRIAKRTLEVYEACLASR